MLNPQYIIRKMTERDLDQVMLIEKESFALPWSRDSYANELSNEYATYLVCDIGGKTAGYAGIWAVYEEAHITNVAVDKKFRLSGLGKNLMNQLENTVRQKRAERILLEVRPSNVAALAMYRNLGYVPSGLRIAYYSDNDEDAIIMTKQLI
ncbi:MAG: ribosomal protein S18-alanine N-acetyltransferase [Syntrophomonadaceae bacterium]|nr:ribosomal protein S18-alanine N-acetyltransferase [Syntrophomonadaceae bacterium]MDD3022611.1 ribosomal protein S18-alanine N-acetyltransferase [Syntrophomonadaceae bacterium]